ncbi:MAG TPA: nucleotidyltransferase family protein [Candidatus Binatia bacterium]|jgi:molybdenum cofactor cytidylyltransferase|nr:nucleotidyltransferase family protein [Candidatus Binatia bacterium]HEX5020541.1 nucleotidyltransferase family protein [Candidatus Binatia bacterium]
MIIAVVLSAGESSRMGRPKALLPIQGQKFIERIIRVIGQSRVGRTIVVLGHHADQLRGQIEHLPVEVVINPDYRSGQLSSLQVAIRHIRDDDRCDGMLVHLVDHPFIDVALVDALIESFFETKKMIVVPSYKGKRGHPVIFSRELFGELLNAPLDQGAKAVVNAHRQETLEIEWHDEGITLDIDTPELYRQHVRGE